MNLSRADVIVADEFAEQGGNPDDLPQFNPARHTVQVQHATSAVPEIQEFVSAEVNREEEVENSFPSPGNEISDGSAVATAAAPFRPVETPNCSFPALAAEESMSVDAVLAPEGSGEASVATEGEAEPNLDPRAESPVAATATAEEGSDEEQLPPPLSPSPPPPPPPSPTPTPPPTPSDPDGEVPAEAADTAAADQVTAADEKLDAGEAAEETATSAPDPREAVPPAVDNSGGSESLRPVRASKLSAKSMIKIATLPFARLTKDKKKKKTTAFNRPPPLPLPKPGVRPTVTPAGAAGPPEESSPAKEELAAGTPTKGEKEKGKPAEASLAASATEVTPVEVAAPGMEQPTTSGLKRAEISSSSSDNSEGEGRVQGKMDYCKVQKARRSDDVTRHDPHQVRGGEGEPSRRRQKRKKKKQQASGGATRLPSDDDMRSESEGKGT